MKVIGDYQQDGYAHVVRLIPEEVAQGFLLGLKQDIGPGAIPLSRVTQHPNLLQRAAFEVYGMQYKPMLYFLWALTPVMETLTGRELLPTYDYFRIYREGDTCRVHSDRYACEHSLSLTIGYSDHKSWNLEIGSTRDPQPSAAVDEGFGDKPFSSIAMQVGDAVLYQGVHHRHGRVTPNPNRWSAHLFLHWVDRHGPYRDQAFEGRSLDQPIDFQFT